MDNHNHILRCRLTKTSARKKYVEKNVACACATKRIKKKIDARSEEAYAVMKHLSSNVKKQDEFDVYGEYMANTLRNL